MAADKSAWPHETRRTRKGLPPVAVLIISVRDQVRRLVRGELALLKAELKQKVTQLGVGAGMLVGAALVAFFFLAALIATGVAALALALPLWLSALIMTVLLLVIGAVLALVGLRKVKAAVPPVPKESIDSIRDDVRALKGDHL